MRALCSRNCHINQTGTNTESTMTFNQRRFIVELMLYAQWEVLNWDNLASGPDVIKLFSCSTQLSMKF